MSLPQLGNQFADHEAELHQRPATGNGQDTSSVVLQILADGSSKSLKYQPLAVHGIQNRGLRELTQQYVVVSTFHQRAASWLESLWCGSWEIEAFLEEERLGRLEERKYAYSVLEVEHGHYSPRYSQQTPHSSSVWATYGCLLWVQTLIYVLPQSLWHCVTSILCCIWLHCNMM